jgi:hypothetical protein
MDVQRIGETFNPSRYHQSFPPEAPQLDEQEGGICDSDDAPVSFRTTLIVDPSLDIWAFGIVMRRLHSHFCLLLLRYLYYYNYVYQFVAQQGLVALASADRT